MQYRQLGKTGLSVSVISIGTWQVGGRWGDDFSDANAATILNKAVDEGINFIDTADVYSEGLSEKAVGKLVRSRKEKIYVATKCGRQLQPHVNEAYQETALRKFVEASLTNMGLETIDLVQLHCPPTAVYYRPEIFGLFDRLKEEGKIQHLGVSVEKVEEGLKAMAYDNVSTIQVIFNMFRQRPAGLLFSEAVKNNIGIIARVPLASGLLTGKFNSSTSFAAGDHRQFNRQGEAFDKGETFSGIDYETGLVAVDALKGLFPGQENLAPLALQWILQFQAVSCIIPGASSVSQLQSNTNALNLPTMSAEQMAGMTDIYEKFIKKSVHQLW